MPAMIKKCGNSAFVRIEPVQKPHFNVDQLIKAITTENMYDVVDFGKPQGKEDREDYLLALAAHETMKEKISMEEMRRRLALED